MSKLKIILPILWLAFGCAHQPRQFDNTSTSFTEMNRATGARHVRLVTVDNKILTVSRVKIDSTTALYIDKAGDPAQIPTAEVAEFTVGTTNSELRTTGRTIGLALGGFLAGALLAGKIMGDPNEDCETECDGSGAGGFFYGVMLGGIGGGLLGAFTSAKIYHPRAEDNRYILNPTWKALYGNSKTYFLQGATITGQDGARVSIAYNGQTGWTLRSRVRIVDGGLMMPTQAYTEAFNWP